MDTGFWEKLGFFEKNSEFCRDSGLLGLDLHQKGAGRRRKAQEGLTVTQLGFESESARSVALCWKLPSGAMNRL